MGYLHLRMSLFNLLSTTVLPSYLNHMLTIVAKTTLHIPRQMSGEVQMKCRRQQCHPVSRQLLTSLTP